MRDAFIERKPSKSLVFMVGMRLADGYCDAKKRQVGVVQVGKSGRFVGHNAVQLR